MFAPRSNRLSLTRTWARSNVLTIVLIIFILLSILLNAFTFAAIYQLRRIVRTQLDTAVVQLGEASRQTIRYDFPIQQTFPVSTTIELNESLDVPIDTVVPIRQRVNVPVEVPVLGSIELPVQLDLDVPVSTTVTVAIDKQIPIETDVDLNTTIPLEINLGEGAIGDVLRELEEALRNLREQL